MKEGYFVNQAIDEAIKLYLASSDKQDDMAYNSFIVVVIRILALIYGRLDILNPYYLNNRVAFLNNLGKYGMSVSDLAMFQDEFLQFYRFEKKNERRKIRIENPYFLTTLKYLIDMFIAKEKAQDVNYQEEEEFLELAYTTHTKNAYRISYGFLMGNEAEYIEKYYYSRLNGISMTREYDFSKTISTDLNLDALNVLGISLSHLKDMSMDEIEAAKKNAYDYFEVDASSLHREEDLKEKVNYYKLFGSKLATGNGYVDILLLISVIVTTISVIAITILSIL